MSAILRDPLPRLSAMVAHMLDCEERAGRVPVRPENCPAWVNISDWSPWPVLSIADGELHIIAVNAVGPKGALKRLIEGGRSAGLSPVIVEPMGPSMPQILKKWGWKQSVVGEGWHAREEWRPA